MNHLKQIAARLPEYGLDAMLLNSEPGEYYAVGFHGEGNVVVTAQGCFYFTDSRYIEAANHLITGGVTETSFNPTAKFEQAYVERKDMEYSYNDGDLYYFMDMETFDMLPISKDLLGDPFRFVKENMSCKVMSYKGSVFGVEPPNFVDLEVTETDPGFKGDTATNVTKPAIVETGAEIKVPLFINPGDKIKIDTRTGEYLERCKG